MVSPKIHKIIIDGNDVTNYVHQFSFMKQSNQPVKQGTIRFTRKIDDFYKIINTIVSKTITIQRGFVSATERYIFRGEIISYQQVGSFYELTFADKMYGCVKRGVDYTYDRNIDTEAGIGSEIVKDILSIGNVPYSNVSVPSTGTDESLLLNIYPAKGAGIDSLKDLAKNYGRQLYYMDSEDLAYFIPQGNISTTTVLTTGVDIFGKIQWNNTSEDMSNNLTIIGGQQLDWNTETFSPSGGTVYTLAAKPIDTDITVGGVQMTRGLNSSNPNDFYVLDDQKQIVFTVAPASTIVISYSYNIPVKVTTTDSVSIDNYTQRDSTVINDKLTNTDDAELCANNLLSSQSNLLTSAPIQVIDNNDLEVGQLITINDTVNNFTKSVVVQSIEYSYPFKPDKVNVGRIPITAVDIELSILTNIANLKQQLSNNGDVNLQLINEDTTVEISGYTKIEKAAPDSGVIYFDSDTQGTWDDYNWGDDTTETYTSQSLIPINQCIFEDFRSNEFKDATTTATWTSGSSVFTGAGMFSLSKTYLVDVNNVVAVTLTTDRAVSEKSTIFTHQISTDGVNWETVIPGTEHMMIDTGVYLYWKITQNGAGTNTINWVRISYR